MKLNELPLTGAYQIEIEAISDERGFFARTWCKETARLLGLDPHLEQCSISYNLRKGTLRGMHFQRDPYGEAKLVRCTRGAIYDVLLDLRPQSATFKNWVGVELSADNYQMVYIPPGLAHGFITLADDSEVFYQISQPYRPEASAGVRWNDPAFSIAWPMVPTVLSERDQSYPEFCLD
jgi:dTDP-4-dehydrorhamnose 3,5-epimerase